MTNSKPISIRLDEDLVDDLDDTIWHLEMQGELPRRTSRSDIIRELVEEWLEENRPEDLEGNGNPAVAAATLE